MQEIMKSEMQLINTSTKGIYLTKYNDELLTKQIVDREFARLKNAFGKKIENGFFDELSNSLRRHKFTNLRLIDAVDNIVDSEDFPSINKIINYGIGEKVYTYSEVLGFVDEGKNMSDYRIIDKEKSLWKKRD